MHELYLQVNLDFKIDECSNIMLNSEVIVEILDQQDRIAVVKIDMFCAEGKKGVIIFFSKRKGTLDD